MRPQNSIRFLAAMALGLMCAVQSAAQSDRPLKGPALAAASNFSQGNRAGMLELSQLLGIHDFRDGMAWGKAETRRGVYDFTKPRTSYPARLAKTGASLSVVLNWGNPIYDDGATPQSPLALTAYGDFTAALLQAFPVINSLEIGNEVNGRNFVRGPMRDMTPQERARAYVPLLQTLSTRARQVRPDIRISGGATHSMAAGFLWEVLDAGGAPYLDALAIHPYTTPAEQFLRQAEVLRRHPLAAGLPIEVTEFAAGDPSRAPSHFLKNYCQFALGGVSRAAWYPMNLRGGKHVPLFTPDGRLTSAGQMYRLIAAKMEDRPVRSFRPDPFTYGCVFDDTTLVVWGAKRPITLHGDAMALGLTGDPIDPPRALSMNMPLIIDMARGAVGDSITLGDTGLIADSYHQYAYPVADEAQALGDGFERFARRGAAILPLVTLPGQDRKGAPWFPYRGNPDLGNVRLTAEVLLPAGRAGSAVNVVHRYTAPVAQTVDATARFAVNKRSKDGIRVTVTLNGKTLFEASGKDPHVAQLRGLALQENDQLEWIVGPMGNSISDLTQYRITLSEG